MNPDSQTIAQSVADQFAALEGVDTVALGGSCGAGVADDRSDIDLHIYCRVPLSVEARASIIGPRASRKELDSDFWGETEDYWLERESGVKVEVAYRGRWVADTLADMFAYNRARLGASTTLWHSVRTSRVLYDREGWFASLKEKADVPYPDALSEAIICKNFAVLRGSLANLPEQLAQAVGRGDVVAAHHFVSVILDSYFDVLFALNKVPHPGSKRMLTYAGSLRHQPEGMSEDVTRLVTCNLSEVVLLVDLLVNRLSPLVDAHLLRYEAPPA